MPTVVMNIVDYLFLFGFHLRESAIWVRIKVKNKVQLEIGLRIELGLVSTEFVF